MLLEAVPPRDAQEESLMVGRAAALASFPPQGSYAIGVIELLPRPAARDQRLEVVDFGLPLPDSLVVDLSRRTGTGEEGHLVPARDEGVDDRPVNLHREAIGGSQVEAGANEGRGGACRVAVSSNGQARAVSEALCEIEPVEERRPRDAGVLAGLKGPFDLVAIGLEGL